MKNKWFFFGSITLVMLLLSLFIPIRVLEIKTDNETRWLKADEFEIGWIHSVEKEPWFESYRVKDDGLYLTGTRFKTFGAGVPAEGKIVPSDDGFVHMTLNRRMEEIWMSASANVRTTLYTKGQEFKFYPDTGESGTVSISSVKVPLWRLIGGIGS